jgi:hypothetical protein
MPRAADAIAWAAGGLAAEMEVIGPAAVGDLGPRAAAGEFRVFGNFGNCGRDEPGVAP